MQTTDGQTHNPDARPVNPLPARPGESIRSEDLFRGQIEVRVLHRGDEYRLRITRQGKLILTK